MNKPVQVSAENYQDACDSYMGWCQDCQDFTRSNTEPDAEDYDCKVCGESNVVGAEQALLIGMIEVGE